MEQQIKIKVTNPTNEKRKASILGFNNIEKPNYGSDTLLEIVRESDLKKCYGELLNEIKENPFVSNTMIVESESGLQIQEIITYRSFDSESTQEINYPIQLELFEKNISENGLLRRNVYQKIKYDKCSELIIDILPNTTVWFIINTSL